MKGPQRGIASPRVEHEKGDIGNDGKDSPTARRKRTKTKAACFNVK